MRPELSSIFSKYEALRSEVDKVFELVSRREPDCVTCKEGCSDCCHAVFDLSLVEAMYINEAFASSIGHGPLRSAVLTMAGETDRKLTRFKREMFRAEKDGESPESIMQKAAQFRLRCPLLNDENRCLLYDARPITCRLYGIPTSIGGHGHVCGFSGFEKDKSYQSVQLDKIQSRLEQLSQEIGLAMQSRFKELHTVYVPLSMALLTKYDDAYLGIGQVREEDR